MTTWTITWNDGLLSTVEAESPADATDLSWGLIETALTRQELVGVGPAPR
jgi:hypothetical protein